MPPCIKKNITQKEWNKIKNETDRWNDIYIPINDSTTIRNLYKLKGNGYIQIGNYGLYHLGKDIYNFGVPEFLIKQQLRIRIKAHGKRKDGSYKYYSDEACTTEFNQNSPPLTIDDSSTIGCACVQIYTCVQVRVSVWMYESVYEDA